MTSRGLAGALIGALAAGGIAVGCAVAGVPVPETTAGLFQVQPAKDGAAWADPAPQHGTRREGAASAVTEDDPGAAGGSPGRDRPAGIRLAAAAQQTRRNTRGAAGNTASRAQLAQAPATEAQGIPDAGPPGGVDEEIDPGDDAMEADESVLLNFERGDIREVIHSLATALGLSYMIDPRVEGQVTIRTIGRIPRDDLFPVFNQILRNNGIAAIEVGGVYQIVPVGEAKTRAILPPTAATRAQLEAADSFVIEIIPVMHVGAEEMVGVLQPFVTPGGDAFAYPRANLLIVTDLASNVERLRDLTKTLDTDAFRGMRTKLYKIEHGDLDIISEELSILLGSYGHAVDGSTGLSMIPMPRLESLVVVSFDPNVFTEIGDWIKVLDIPPEEGGGRKVFVYRVENAKAADLATILNELFGGSGGGGAVSGRAFGQERSAFGRVGGTVGRRGGLTGATAQPLGQPMSRARTAPQMSAGGGARTARQISRDPASRATQVGRGQQLSAQQRRGGRQVLGGQAGAAGAVGVVLPGGQQAGGRFAGIPGPPPIFKEEVRIVADEVTNSLVILAVKQDYEKVIDVLKEIDVVPRQVVIEVIIAEVTLSKGLEFGVDHAVRTGGAVDTVWAVRNFKGATGTSGDGDGDGDGDGNGTGTGTDLGSALFSLANPGAGGLAAFITDKDNFLVFLRALASKSAVKIISAPNIIAADNREAHIQVGSSIPILTGTSTSLLTDTSTVVNSVQYRDVGTILTILPQVNSAGLVNMQVSQELSAVGEESFGLTNSPSFLTREAETTVVVQNNDSVLIGGIIDEQKTTTRDGVPFFMDIPVLGRFFRLERDQLRRTELLILITPHVIRNRDEALSVTEQFKRLVHGLDRMLESRQRDKGLADPRPPVEQTEDGF